MRARNFRKCSICDRKIANSPHFEVIVPLYRSESHIVELIKYINSLSNSVAGGVKSTFVIDGRHSDFIALLSQIETLQSNYQIIKLSKNFGVGPALHSGLENSVSCVSAAFGSDLQEPMNLFVEFFQKTISLESDIAIGYRLQRKDPIISGLFSKIYWWVSKKWIHPESPKGGLDVFAMNKKVRKEFIKLRELNTNFTSQLLWIGYRISWIGFERSKRLNGKSTWTFKKKIRLFSDSVYGYTSKPISIITWSGFLSSLFFLILGAFTFFGKVSGAITVPGYAMTVLLISFGQSITILSLGILGGYIYRTFENGTGRPHYIIDQIYSSSD
jgi:hypothetical protein